jgi:hypothetical protein
MSRTASKALGEDKYSRKDSAYDSRGKDLIDGSVSDFGGDKGEKRGGIGDSLVKDRKVPLREGEGVIYREGEATGGEEIEVYKDAGNRRNRRRGASFRRLR